MSIPIERLWAPVSDADAPVQFDEQGYLLPRDHYLQRRCLANDEFDDVGLAMLRGESGAGKTYAIDAMMARLQAAGRPFHYVDLARVDTGQALREELRSVLDASVVDAHGRYVFLDDLEKCQLHALDRHLEDVLRALASQPLRVRIAYRAGSLTQQAELRYRTLFTSALVVDLLPLTRRAVLGVLETVRHPAEDLLEILEQQDLVPLLVQPVTLRMLANLIAAGRPIVRVVQAGTDEDKQHVLEAVLQDDLLRARLRWFVGEIELGSTAAAEMKAAYARHERRARPPQPQPPTLGDSALQIVQSTCAGDLDAFVEVYRALSGQSQSFGIAMSSPPR